MIASDNKTFTDIVSAYKNEIEKVNKTYRHTARERVIESERREGKRRASNRARRHIRFTYGLADCMMRDGALST